MKPEKIEKSVDHFFESVAQTLAKSTEAGRLFALGALFYIIHIATPLYWTQNYPQWSRLYLVSDRYWLTIFLVAISYFYRWLPKPWFNAAALTMTWVASSTLNGADSLWICVYPLYY